MKWSLDPPLVGLVCTVSWEIDSGSHGPDLAQPAALLATSLLECLGISLHIWGGGALWTALDPLELGL